MGEPSAMRPVHAARPDTVALAAGLNAALAGVGRAGGVAIAGRATNDYSSTFPSERLLCRFADGSTHALWCKFGDGRTHASFGHRGDVRYEARVYRDLLAGLPLALPEYFGTFERADGEVWLFVESLDGAVEVEEFAPQEMPRAAAWAGEFHRLMAPRVADPALGFVTRYDADYHRQWPRRTRALAGHWHERLPWLDGLCERAEAFAPELVREAATVIHGEYTPSNVLARGAAVYPVDWESAAIGLGEIDLVCLTDKWPTPVARACEAAYRAARWPDGEPAGFERRLDLARLYWDLRWLGDRPEWTLLEKVGPRFEHLRAVATRLGVIA